MSKCDWTMSEARQWVKEHEGKSAHEISQEEIIDEIDYLKTLIDKEGLSEKGKESFEDLMRVSGYDNPVEIKLEDTTIQDSLKTLSEIIKKQLEV